jgi:hypothetical protein
MSERFFRSDGVYYLATVCDVFLDAYMVWQRLNRHLISLCVYHNHFYC